MSQKKGCSAKSDVELKKAKLTIEKLQKDAKKHQQEIVDKMAEAFLIGFEEAMIEIESKTKAFDDYMEKAASGFEKVYYASAKKTAKKPAKKKKIAKKK